MHNNWQPRVYVFVLYCSTKIASGKPNDTSICTLRCSVRTAGFKEIKEGSQKATLIKSYLQSLRLSGLCCGLIQFYFRRHLHCAVTLPQELMRCRESSLQFSSALLIEPRSVVWAAFILGKPSYQLPSEPLIGRDVVMRLPG